LIWGYAKGFSYDLGVRGYQKVENRWSILYNYITITINYIKKLIITFVCNYARVSTAKTKELKTVTNAEVDG
jgi:hypothetical protein